MPTGLKKRLSAGYAGWKESKAAAFIRKRKTLLLCLVFAVVALTEGIYYSRKVPFGQVPDELAHYQMLEDEWGTGRYYTAEMTTKVYFAGGFDLLPGNADQKIDPYLMDDVKEVRFDTPLTFGSFHPGITAIRHLPSSLGLYLGIALGLPIVTCTFLAELFSVLFFVGIGCLTLKITPVRKEMFVFCMLIPEVLQQCASVNYDAVAFPCAFLLFAIILKHYYSEEKIRWRHLWPVALLSAVLLLVKPPYALLILAGLIIPADHYELKIGKKFELAGFVRRHWIPVVAGIIALGAAGVWVMRENYYVKVILSDLTDFPAFTALLMRTWRGLGVYHLTQMVGIFGWLDSQVSQQFILVFFMMAVYLCAMSIDNTKQTITGGRRIWLLVVAAVVVLMTELALQAWTYEYWELPTDVSIAELASYIPTTETILGVQGRYWIPILPLVMTAFCGAEKRKHIKTFWTVQAVYYLYALINVSRVLNQRYWIW